MIVKFLNQEFSDRVCKNQRYSLRAFARALKTDSSTLSAILSRKRPITAKNAVKLLKQLEIEPSMRDALLMSAFGPSSVEGVPDYEQLRDEVFAAISNWEYSAILSLVQTKSAKPHSARSIAQRLGISIACAIQALERLERLGLLAREDRRWKRTKVNLTTSHDVPSASLKTAHRQMIGKSLFALDHDDITDRDITGITMPISVRKLPKAKEMIRNFRRELSAFLEDGPKERVYRLNIQLFSLERTKS